MIEDRNEENINIIAGEDEERHIILTADQENDTLTTQEKQKKDAEENDEKQARNKFSIFTTMERFGDLFLLNILFIFTSIPIITMGASFSAVYYVVLKMARNEEGVVRQDYFKAFKQNFKQATICWIGILIISATMYLEYGFILSNENVGNYMMVILALEMLIMTIVLPFLFPLIARYENTTGNIIKNSFILAVSNIGTWLSVLISWIIPIVIYYIYPMIFYYTWYLWILILVSTIAYANAFSLRKLFDKIEEA